MVLKPPCEIRAFPVQEEPLVERTRESKSFALDCVTRFDDLADALFGVVRPPTPPVPPAERVSKPRQCRDRRPQSPVVVE
jgi:hypothetical protein